MEKDPAILVCDLPNCLCAASPHSGTPTIKLKSQIQGKAKEQPCMDCGKTWPKEAMHFDHRERASKVHDISRLVKFRHRWNDDTMERHCTMQEFLDEIAKCDIVCACCHACRTFGKENPYAISTPMN